MLGHGMHNFTTVMVSEASPMWRAPRYHCRKLATAQCDGIKHMQNQPAVQGTIFPLGCHRHATCLLHHPCGVSEVTEVQKATLARTR